MHVCVWAPPSGWLYYYRLYFFMVLVEFCVWLCLYLFTDSTWCHILLGTSPWFCICGRFQLGKTYLGAVAMAGQGGILRLSLKFANIGWSSIRYWLSIDWLLVIDQSLIYVLLLTHRHPPGSHTLHKFSKSYWSTQMYSNLIIHAN